MTTNAKLVLENLEATTISCLLQDGSLFEQAEDTLTSKDYKQPSLRLIFESIRDLALSEVYPDPISVKLDLEKKGYINSLSLKVEPENEQPKTVTGKAVIDELLTFPAAPTNFETYAYQLREVTVSRELDGILNNSIRDLHQGVKPENVLSTLDVKTGNVSTILGIASKNIQTGQQVALGSIAAYRKVKDGEDPYIETGLYAWDSVTYGLYPSRVYMVAAASGEGKSTLALSILNNITINDSLHPELNEKKIKGYYLTMESDSNEIGNKIAQMKTGISSMRIEKGKLSDDEEKAFITAMNDIAESPLLLDDSTEVTLAVLRSKLRKAVAAGARFAIIDQLDQVLAGVGADKRDYRVINFIVYRIKAYARELHIPIILIHQMNRSANSGKNRGKDVEVNNADLAEAGEKAVDAVCFVRQPQGSSPYLNWTKHRQGEKKKVRLKFVTGYGRFDNLDGDTDVPDDELVDDDNLFPE